MHRESYSRTDLRLTVGIVAMIALCTVYIRLEYDKAFPQASIKLRLSKPSVTSIADRFLNGRSLKTTGYRQITVFDPDDDARLYLERELGLERANQLMQGEVAVWRWRARWFRPPEQEEMLVWVTPDQGRIAGFEHVIPEAAAGARLTHDQAFQLAHGFVSSMSSAPARIVEDRLEQKPNRYDYLFTWEQEGFRAKDATYRRTVVVQGSNLGRYLEFLYVPEEWRRNFASLRSRNELYASIAEAFWLPLILAALFLLVRGLRRHEIPWRPLVLMCGVVGALTIASQLNSIPLLVDRFPTSSPYLQTLLLIVLTALGSGVGVFFYVIVAGAAGEPLYRRQTADRLSLRTAFTREGLSSRGFYRAVLVGYGFAAVHIAFLVAFYLIGRRFGVWSPQDVQYSDLLSTALPWIYPVAIAGMAASAEEFWFRLLAIPLLERVLRVRWIAVIVPAFIWGFLHANYPQQPAWIRGVEVGMIGVAAGFLMLRFGIVATLVWHYTVDAMLIGSNLFDAPSVFYRLNGIALGLAVLAPLIASVVLYRRNRGFVVLEEPAAVQLPPPVITTPEYVPLPRPVLNPRWLYAAAAVAGLLGLLASPTVFGDWIRIRLDRPAAEAIARRSAPESSRWRTVTDFISNLDAAEFEYLRRAAGTGAAQRIVRERKPTAVWRTRFFRPLEKEEWRVYVDQTGAIIRKDHILDERAPGDRLSAEDALHRAQSLARGWMLVDSSEERRDKRSDWSFVFEDPQFHAGAARSRVSLQLLGSEPSNLRRFLKLPEEWLREFQKPALRNFVLPAAIGSLILPLLILFLRRLGSHETIFHWTAYLSAAALAIVLSAAAALNQWTTAMSGYDTATPEQNYLTQYLIARGVTIVLAGTGIFAIVLAVDVFRQARLGRAALNPPSFERAVAVLVLLAGTARVLSWVADRIPGPRTTVALWSLRGLDSYVPGLPSLTFSFFGAIVTVCSAGILVFWLLRFMGMRQRVITAGMLVAALAFSAALTVLQFIAYTGMAILWLGVVLLIAGTCAADLIGIGVALFWLLALDGAFELMQQPSAILRWNGASAGVVAAAFGVLVIVFARRRAAIIGPREP